MRQWWTTRRVYMAMQWVNSFTFYLWLTIQAVYHIEVVKLTAFQLVLVATVLEGTILIFETPTGIVADTYSRRMSIIIAAFICSIGLLLEGTFATFGLVLLANVIWGFGWTFLSGANDAWVTDELGEEAGNEAILFTSQWSPAASLLGIVVSVGLAQISTNLPILLAGGITLGLGLFLLAVMQETNFKRDDSHQSPLQAMRTTLNKSFGVLKLKPILLIIIIVGGIRGIWAGGFHSLWTAFLLERYTFPRFGIEVWVGIMKAAVLLLSIFGIGTVRKRLNLKEKYVVSKILQFLYTVIIITSIAFFAVGKLWLAVILFLINQTALSICRPLFIAWINQHTETRIRATMISMYWQSVSLASVIGGPIIGWIAVIRSIQQAMIMASFAISPALLLFSRGRKIEENETPSV